MSRALTIKRTMMRGGLAVLALSAVFVCGRALAQAPNNDDFVKRDGTRLTLGGETFRFGGPNIEWLGVAGYGPFDPMGPHYPSHAEVNDALDTAKMMGARVVRSQTLGDSIGCPECIEPKLGEFNPAAFKQIDYVLKAAHDRGLRLIFTLAGDCANCELSGPGEYFKDMGPNGAKDFFTDPKIISRFEAHIAALLNHKNSLTGVAYKDDPTILAWENCNVCGIFASFADPGGNMGKYVGWVDTIGNYIKSIDKKHMYEDNSGFFLFDKSGAALDTKTTDIITSEYYPHWDAMFAMLGGGAKTTAETFPKHAEMITSHGKVYVVNEFGWDVTDWATQEDLAKVLQTMKDDPKISGDLFWALQAHNTEFGWQPLPVNVPNKAYSERGESGQWWALYYGGIDTLVNTKADMQARAELLRSHAFEIAGLPVPPHAIPPAPVMTTKAMGVIGWRGSAGAVNYSIERQDTPGAAWQTICDKCATDSDTPWIDPKPGPGIFTTQYRVIAYNADGKASEPSAAR